MPLLHVALPHSTLGPWQMPCPLHRPPSPQRVLVERKPQSATVRHWPRPLQALVVLVRSVTHCASNMLQLTGPHAASVAAARQMPVVAQVSQMPLQAELQHTPSTQLLVLHSAPVLQASPLPFLGSEQLPAFIAKVNELWAAVELSMEQTLKNSDATALAISRSEGSGSLGVFEETMGALRASLQRKVDAGDVSAFPAYQAATEMFLTGTDMFRQQRNVLLAASQDRDLQQTWYADYVAGVEANAERIPDIQRMMPAADIGLFNAAKAAYDDMVAAMDKAVAKELLQTNGLPVAAWRTVREHERVPSTPGELATALGLPVFVKPANMGSSIGVSRAASVDELDAALDEALRYDDTVVVEELVTGREIEVAVLGNDAPRASVPGEIVPSHEFYDYEDKYLLDQSEVRLPAPLDEGTTDRLRGLAVEAFRALGCEGMARVDFFLETSTGSLYVNEVNTIPGFTSISMFPKMWEHSGLPYPKLLDRLIDLALARHARKRAM